MRTPLLQLVCHQSLPQTSFHRHWAPRGAMLAPLPTPLPSPPLGGRVSHIPAPSANMRPSIATMLEGERSQGAERPVTPHHRRALSKEGMPQSPSSPYLRGDLLPPMSAYSLLPGPPFGQRPVPPPHSPSPCKLTPLLTVDQLNPTLGCPRQLPPFSKAGIKAVGSSPDAWVGEHAVLEVSWAALLPAPAASC